MVFSNFTENLEINAKKKRFTFYPLNSKRDEVFREEDANRLAPVV